MPKPTIRLRKRRLPRLWLVRRLRGAVVAGVELKLRLVVPSSVPGAAVFAGNGAFKG
ncbi:MAG: hypothetical protein ACYC3I_07170 [Gemmataceae bacterium]